jgi:hypothetical protein
MYVELPAEIECPTCGTKNKVNLVDLAEGQVLTCSECKGILVDKNIEVEAKDVKALLKGAQSSMLKNFVITFAIFAVIIFLIMIGVSKALHIQMEDEVILFILGIFGAIFVLLLGVIWSIKKWFAIFD